MQKRLRLPTVLIITDRAPVRAWLKKHLEEPFFVLEASTAEEALQIARTNDLQYLILDATLEDSDPLQLAGALKKCFPQYFTPFFLITGRLKKSFRDAALEAGITDFLSDQLDSEELETRFATAQKILSLQNKTTQASFALQRPKQELSSNYFKNKFLLHDQALRLITKSKTEKQPLAMLLIRLDSFSSLQNRYGYWALQKLLSETSNLLSQFFQEQDLLIPSSEGQWIVLLPSHSSEKAKALAEKIGKEIQLHPFLVKNESFHLTISIVLTSLEATESDFYRMTEAALKALKQAQTTTNLILSLDKESSS
jgi:diguanylate cyclase (GGDEF)-like protein